MKTKFVSLVMALVVFCSLVVSSNSLAAEGTYQLEMQKGIGPFMLDTNYIKDTFVSLQTGQSYGSRNLIPNGEIANLVDIFSNGVTGRKNYYSFSVQNAQPFSPLSGGWTLQTSIALYSGTFASTFNWVNSMGWYWGNDGIKGNSDDVMYTNGIITAGQIVNWFGTVGVGSTYLTNGSTVQQIVDRWSSTPYKETFTVFVGDGNSIQTTTTYEMSVVPEPSTVAFLFMGGFMTLAYRYRRTG